MLEYFFFTSRIR